MKALADRLRNVFSGYWLLWIAPLAFMALFYFYPMLNILAVSFGRSQAGVAAPFVEAFTTRSELKILGFTFWQATLSTALTLLFGLPGAYLLARYRLWGKRLILAMTGVSFVLPTLVVAAAFNALLGPRGWVNLLLMQLLRLEQPPVHFVNTFVAILIAHVFYNTTIVLRMVGDFWAHLDPRLGQAAQRVGRQWLADITPRHSAAADAGHRFGGFVGFHIRLHLLWGDPGARRAALCHPGGRDL